MCTVVEFRKPPRVEPRRATRMDKLRCLMTGHSYGSGPEDVDWKFDAKGWAKEFSCARRCGYWTDRPVWVGAWLAWFPWPFMGAFAMAPLGGVLASWWHGLAIGACLATLVIVLWGDRPGFTDTGKSRQP